MPIFINRRNSKRINPLEFEKIINKLCSFKGDYITIESFVGFINREKLYSVFNLNQDSENQIYYNDNLTYKEFIFFCFRYNLHLNNENLVLSIINEFEYITELTAQIVSSAFDGYLPEL